jgi:long-chain fatty acid transport protein
MRGAVLSLLVTLAILPATPAGAGGMFLPGRGVRPMARGGAFTAGADDLNALAYNPAGLADMLTLSPDGDRWHLLLDVGVIKQNVDFTRVDSGGMVQPTVHNLGSPTPIPTLGVAYRLRDDLVGAIGLFAPYTSVPSYPLDGPQRYSLVNLDGTVIATTEGALAWQPSPHLRIGAGLQLVILDFSSIVVFSGCPHLIICTPEDRDFDAAAQIRDFAIVPSGNAGVQGIWDGLRVGFSVQLPVWVSSVASVRVPALPKSAYFDAAHVEGDQATLSFTLPLVARAGLEVRPARGIRAEVEVDYEAWSMHDAITITPQNIRIVGSPGTDVYQMSTMTVGRHFEDTFSLHFGAEWAPNGWLTLRLGYAYEPSAVPPAYMSVLSPDGDKTLLSAGLGVSFGKWRLDGMYTHVIQDPRDVTGSRDYALNPIRPPSQTPIGNGHYDVSGDILGAGLQTSF